MRTSAPPPTSSPSPRPPAPASPKRRSSGSTASTRSPPRGPAPCRSPPPSSSRPAPIVEFAIEGGGPMKMKIEEANVEGFLSPQENGGYFRYAALCTFYGSPLPREAEREEKKKKKPRFMLVFMCIPVSLGKSRILKNQSWQWVEMELLR